MSDHTNIQILEQYTQENPQEVLIIQGKEGNKVIEIMIFKGFSSCLSGATEFNPDLPILSSCAEIIAIDRLYSPYNPQNPQYIARNLTWQEFQSQLLSKK